MKRTIIAVSVLALAACGEAEDPVEDVTEVTVAEPQITEITPGLYAVGDETTEYGRTRLNDDGTYSDYAEDTEVGSGTWTADGATMCFDPAGDGEEEQERCWTNGETAEDGSFTTTRDDGSMSYTVTPISE